MNMLKEDKIELVDEDQTPLLRKQITELENKRDEMKMNDQDDILDGDEVQHINIRLESPH